MSTSDKKKLVPKRNAETESYGPLEQKVDEEAPTLEDLCDSISEYHVETYISALQDFCGTLSEHWICYLASFLNTRLPIGFNIDAWSSKSEGYPCTLLKTGVRKLLVKNIENCDLKFLEKLHDNCLRRLVQDVSKGQPMIGFTIMLQCIVKEMSTKESKINLEEPACSKKDDIVNHSSNIDPFSTSYERRKEEFLAKLGYVMRRNLSLEKEIKHRIRQVEEVKKTRTKLLVSVTSLKEELNREVDKGRKTLTKLLVFFTFFTGFSSIGCLFLLRKTL